MDEKTLAKLAILAEKDPAIAQQFEEQAQAISDEELEQATGGGGGLVDRLYRVKPPIWR